MGTLTPPHWRKRYDEHYCPLPILPCGQQAFIYFLQSPITTYTFTSQTSRWWPDRILWFFLTRKERYTYPTSTWYKIERQNQLDEKVLPVSGSVTRKQDCNRYCYPECLKDGRKEGSNLETMFIQVHNESESSSELTQVKLRRWNLSALGWQVWGFGGCLESNTTLAIVSSILLSWNN